MKHLITAFALTATVSTAQMLPFGNVGDYRIATVEGQQVCVMTLETLSAANKPMVYSFYATPFGQRWHVVGFADPSDLPSATVGVTVTVDGATTLQRNTQTSDGDFMLPFETLAEIEGHENAIADGETLEIAMAEASDQVTLQLATHRIALKRMQDCLDAL